LVVCHRSSASSDGVAEAAALDALLAEAVDVRRDRLGK